LKASVEARRLWPFLLPFVQKAVAGVTINGGGGGTGGPVGGAPSPHALSSSHHTGTLTDAQGPQFLLASGARQLTGNLIVASGVTIDGVDLSAHAANANAHHNAATAGNGITIAAGQVVSTRLKTNSGLEVDSNGLAIADATAGGGLGINSSKQIFVNAGDGIQLVSDSVAIQLGANSGMTVSPSGLFLGGPSSSSQASTNAVSGTTHSHEVIAASDVSAGATSILKSTAAGGLGLASLFTTGAVDVGQGFTAGNTGFRVIYHTHDYNHVHVVVNPTGLWNLDEQFGLDIDDNLLVRGWIVGKHAIQVADAKMLVHYDGPPPVEKNFVGNPTGHMGQVGAITGGVIFREGKFGKSASIGEATTNLITNPSFETGTTGWANLGAGTISQTSIRSVTGSSSLLVQAGVGSGGTKFTVSLSTSTTYTLSLEIYPVFTGSQLFIQIWNVTPATQLAQISWTPTAQGWQRQQITFTTSASHTNYEIRVYHNSDVVFYLDNVQLEQKGYATPYADGALGTGHSWSGTVHASTSSRTAARISYDDVSLADYDAPMTVMAWVRPATNGTNGVICSRSTDGQTHGWEFVNSSGTLRATLFNPTVNCSGGTLTVNQWNFVCFTYDRANILLYLNGALLGSGVAATQSVNTTEPFRVGCRFDGNQFNGRVDEVSLLARVLTGDEIRAIYESNAPVFAETSTWHWRAGRNRIYADSEGLWGIGANSGAILGLYAGVDNTPGATKSWGGVSLSEGDLLLGRYGAANGGWMWFDQNLVSGNPAWMFGYGDKEVLRLDSGGASFTGVLDIDTSGGIFQGTGTFASPTTGLKIWNDGGIGRIGGYGSGTLQWSAATDGKLTAGGGAVLIDAAGVRGKSGGTTTWEGNTSGKLTAGTGNVIMDETGLTILAKVDTLALHNFPLTNSVLWKRGSTAIAGISGQSTFNTTNYLVLSVEEEASIYTTANILLQAMETSGSTTSMEIMSNDRVHIAGGNLTLGTNWALGIGTATPGDNVTGTYDYPSSVVFAEISGNDFARLLIKGNVNAGFDLVDAGASSNNKRVLFFTDDGIVRLRSVDDANNTVADNILTAEHSTGNVGVGTATLQAKLHVSQPSTTAAIPVLLLNQADVSEPMIRFFTTIGTGNAIEAVGAKTLTTTHFIKVELPGGLIRYIPAGTIA
jgi:hypothetical protein